MILKELVVGIYQLGLKSGSSRFTCVLYVGLAKGGFQLKVGVRLICGCDLYPSIYGSSNAKKCQSN